MIGLTKILFSLVISFLLFCSFIIIISQLNFKKPRARVLTLQALSLILILYAIWPLLPNQTGVERTASTFLTALSQGDSDGALDLIVGYVGISEPNRLIYAEDIVEPANHLQSWEITSINLQDTVIAKVQFADGEEDEIILIHSWDWGKARWGISSAFFQNDRERLRLIEYTGITNQYPFIPHQLFYTLTIILGVISLLSGRKYIPELRNIFAR